jgi:multisubunit Na+/H+ antiporter MnhG subunit
MELFIILGYVAVCIAIFTLLRIPLNRRTVPTASIGGILLVFAFIQVLNFYHPY